MLDEFLERRIKNKLELYVALGASNQIDVKRILTVVSSSEYNVRSLLEELEQDFKGIAEIKKEQQYYTLHVKRGINALKLRHAIYSTSAVLQCLKFFIMNEEGITYTDYTRKAYLSKTDAYRIKKKCQEYLQSVGLDLKNNKVVGDEYRIRFLIALLYYTYGIDCCGIDSRSIKLARQFVLSTNQAVDLELLESAENEYGYFECLLILSWKRKEYLPFENHGEVMERSVNLLKELKQVFIYSKISEYVKTSIEYPLQIRFSEQDYDYIYLAYLCANNCVLADKWQAEDFEQICQIVFNNSVFADLIHKIRAAFGEKVIQNQAMQRVLFYFCKRFLFQLQCINPDLSFYFDFLREPSKVELACQMTELLNKWREDNDIQYQISKAHILYLSVQIEVILRQTVPPIRVVVVSDMTSEMDIMKMVLRRRYSTQRIELDEFFLNTTDRRGLSNLENCVIIVHHRLKNMIEAFMLPESNSIIFVRTEMNRFDMNEIGKAVYYHGEQCFLELVRKNGRDAAEAVAENSE